MDGSAPAPVPFALPAQAAVCDAVRRDSQEGLLAAWAASTVIDEFTRVPSITQDLFDALHESGGVSAVFPAGHAGIIHVYGYWFSTVPTPFGYKRDRWADGQLARALGLPSHAFLLDERGEHTLLSRVTAAVSPVLQSPPESVHLAEARIDGCQYRLVLSRMQNDGPHALIYGVRDAEAASPGFQIITTFPFAGDPVALCREFREEPKLRWNAVARNAVTANPFSRR